MLRNSWKGEQRTPDPCWLEEGHGRGEVRRDELGPPVEPTPSVARSHAPILTRRVWTYLFLVCT